MPRHDRPTMADVATLADVSLKTVSRVVNGERHVSAEVTARVLDAILQLDYRPDLRARNLAGPARGGRMIGVVQVDAANPFFGLVNRGLEDVTAPLGWTIVTGSTDANPAHEETLVGTLIDLRVDGLVVIAAEGSDELLRREARRGTAIVCVDRVLDDADCDIVVSDNRDTTLRAVTHLHDIGHRRIAFIGGNLAIWTAQERHAGYLQALQANQLRRDPTLVVTDADTVDRAADATRRLLDADDPPTAIFTAQDRITTGAVIALHELGRHRDTALFGYDDIPFAAQLDPSVSTIAQDPRAMGQRAAELLIARLENRTEGHHMTVLDAPLCHRASGDIRPRARD
jgi:LacI family transcriptional regulator